MTIDKKLLIPLKSESMEEVWDEELWKGQGIVKWYWYKETEDYYENYEYSIYTELEDWRILEFWFSEMTEAQLREVVEI